MAGSTVLERTTEKTAENSAVKTVQTEELSAAERAHNERRAEYLKLLYADSDEEIELKSAPAPEAVSAPVAEPAPAAPNAAQRLADYRAYAAPETRHTLFEGITYKDGELISDVAIQTAPEAVSAAKAEAAPAVQAQVSVAPAPTPVYVPAEEDALPTQRTMDTLRQAMAEAGTTQKASLFSGVSTRAIVALAAILFAVVVAIVVICINTGIIRSLDASIASLSEEVAEKQAIYEDLVRERDDILNFEGSIQDLVEEYAEAHGMTRG